MPKDKILVGAHMSIEGGLHKAIERAKKIGCTTMQIFTKNNRSWFAKNISNKEANIFKEHLQKSSLKKIMAHASYLINLGSKNKDVLQKSTTALKKELERCEQLNIPYLIVHPGSHVGLGEEKSIQQIAKTLDLILKTTSGKTKILLETMAGQGTSVAHTFEQLKKTYSLCSQKKNIGICFDTCHVFAAGYDLTSQEQYKKTWAKFKRILGIRLLKAIHLNDSKTELGSKKDRHENLGKGKIPIKIFELIMNDSLLKNIPKVLETPNGEIFYKKEIALLKKMVK
jgi:deoxyribonuclease IV